MSCEKTGLGPIEFEKNERGVPQPFKSVHWSISHKPEYVAGVVANTPVGIDIEVVKPVSQGLFKKIVLPDEKKQFERLDPCPDTAGMFFRTFTAKEAVLKRSGCGINEMSRARVVQVDDETHLSVLFKGEKIGIEHFYLDDHIASVTKDLFDIHWKFFDSPANRDDI